TEAAAATAVVMMKLSARLEKPKQPIEVKVDRPFLYAIQDIPSAACLFIGRVTDPRQIDMDISTLANLINAVAVTAGVIFAATRIPDYRRQRKRHSMLALVRSFQSPT